MRDSQLSASAQMLRAQLSAYWASSSLRAWLARANVSVVHRANNSLDIRYAQIGLRVAEAASAKAIAKAIKPFSSKISAPAKVSSAQINFAGLTRPNAARRARSHD
jgi:hypothetical protein